MKKQPGRLLGAGVIGLAALSISSGAMSLALFTDQESVDGTFSSGTIVLDAAKIDALTFSSGVMVPGDSKKSPVIVENDGSSELRYSITTASTDTSSPNGGALYEVLTLAIRQPDTGTGAFGTDGDYCDDETGTSVETATALGAGSTVVGNTTAGVQSDERAVAGGSSEVLCFEVELPSATGNTYQGASTTTTFTFDAEKTAHNA